MGFFFEFRTSPVAFLFHSVSSHQMDRAAASLLWFALWVGMGWTGAPRSASPRRTDTSMRRKDQSVNGSVVLHDYMLYLYRTLSKLQPRDIHISRGAGFANTVTSFVDQGKDQPSWESGQRYIFDLSSLPRMDELVEAELRILRKPAADLLTVLTTGGNLYNIHLYSCSPSNRQLLDSRTVEVLDSSLPKWEVFDVWSSMKARQRNPTEPLQACFHLLALSELTNEVADPLLLGLDRQTRLAQEKALLVAFSHTDTSDNLFRDHIMEKIKNEAGGFRLPKPLKLTLKHEKKHQRQHQRALSKRSFGETGQGAAAGGGNGGKTGRRRIRCSRKSLHVNFRDLGWDDWIIAPLDYEAHHCDGVCDFPLRSHLEPTNHAVIQTLMNSMDPDISPSSCCVPSKLSPISILYIDAGNNVVYRQYEDMVVESCGCR
ncbi:growth/differentiation factor 6-A [Thunnus maccoyii]|uniref:growth/differentiation factor 6-A n=1 Tax=Thunnus maccoyii TaxID=8240 RepID=UPI001C4AF779|nr:growth/differentiation factor 6-A [Thunnus maccoyii]